VENESKDKVATEEKACKKIKAENP